jgi:hypothetical protein
MNCKSLVIAGGSLIGIGSAVILARFMFYSEDFSRIGLTISGVSFLAVGGGLGMTSYGNNEFMCKGD